MARRRGRGAWLVALAGMAMAATSAGAAEPSLRGKVLRVVDGDTVQVKVQGQGVRRIRLASIDAPELGSPERPGQPYGATARRHLDGLLGRATVMLTCHDVDPHGRPVCDLHLPAGGTASQAMAAAGLAWANREGDGRFLRDAAVAAGEARARAARRGLWQDERALAPWHWRRACWRDHRCNG